MKMQLLIEEDDDDTFDDLESLDEDLPYAGTRTVRIASKIPFPKPEYNDWDRLRSQIVAMIDAANNPGDMSQDLLLFYKNWIIRLSTWCTEGKH